jgi:hypothetical protein
MAWFRERFGDRVEVTVEAAEQRASEVGVFWDWLAGALLTDSQKYREATRAAYRKYYRIVHGLGEESANRIVHGLGEESANRIIHDLGGNAIEHRRALAEVDRVCAVAFARLYIEQSERGRDE